MGRRVAHSVPFWFAGIAFLIYGVGNSSPIIIPLGAAATFYALIKSLRRGEPIYRWVRRRD